jgi:hypothetical protein
MQTFLPYSNFHLCAEVLDRQRLGKQRVEALQILKALKQGPITQGRVTGWYNHPAVQMWKGYEIALMEYLHAMCHEWTAKRGYEDTCWVKAIEVGPSPTNIGVKTKMPPWLGNTSFHLSHQSNLLRKNPEHYGQFFMGISKDLPYVWPTKNT